MVYQGKKHCIYRGNVAR